VLYYSVPPSIVKYDRNGNLTNDGYRSFGYDAENQLTNITVAGSYKSDFIYDGLGRRRITRESTWAVGAWSAPVETRSIYDGNLIVQEQDANNHVLVSYTRGQDLSGSLQGAGGIGGLLARTDGTGSTYYHADGSGNIMALVNSSQNMAARYLYNPFGQIEGKWGALADANEMQFSSMPHHNNSNLSLYPFRGYEPNLQRWLNQDPIQEAGGINMYKFAGNNPLHFIDIFGLFGQGQMAETSPYGINGPPEISGPFSGLTYDRPKTSFYPNYDPNPPAAELPESPFAPFSLPTTPVESTPYHQEKIGPYNPIAADALILGTDENPASSTGQDIGKNNVENTLINLMFPAPGMSAPVKCLGSTLTAAERAEIQSIAHEFNTTIDVVGSRAKGRGRNINSMFPPGKHIDGGPPTKSDIDFRIDADHDRVDELIDRLNNVGNGAGSAGKQWSFQAYPTEPPFIRFFPKKN
jgi:RHS repeat-associated protein